VLGNGARTMTTPPPIGSVSPSCGPRIRLASLGPMMPSLIDSTTTSCQA
jgi:hypothetical protein